MLAGLVLGACAERGTLRALGLQQSYFGGVVGDEPNSVVAARNILASGGNAADAAVALYFTSAVTYPAGAALGGGGACLVYDPDENRVEALEFPATAPNAVRAGATVNNAVPAAPRGMSALQARYGRLQWRQLLGQAEQMARIGHPISRALARDIALVAGPLFADPVMAKLFARPDGTPLQEGDSLVQLDLAALLTIIRTRGPGTFYNGDLARKLVEATQAAGGSLTIEDMREYRPVWRDSIWLRYEFERMHVVPPPGAGGVILLQMWNMLTDGGRYDGAADDERGHLLAAIGMRAFADRGTTMPIAEQISEDRAEDLMADYRPDARTPAGSLPSQPVAFRESPAGSSFVVIDGDGGAVACTITLNSLFGIGRIAAGTGIVLAAAPSSAGRETSSQTPVLLVSHDTKQVLFAGAASGGAAAPSALAEVMARTLIDGEPLDVAIKTPRIHHGGFPDVVIYETTEQGARLQGLSRRGYKVLGVTELGRVNAISCMAEYKTGFEGCQISNDRRGFGIGTVANY